MKIIMKHWTEGGTCVTNFTPDRLPIFQEAVRQYGNPDFIVIEEAIQPAPKDYGGSLHVGGGFRDISPFWDLYRELEALGVNGIAYNRAMGVV